MSLHTVSNEIFLPTRPDYADFNVPVESSLRMADILQCLKIATNQQVALYAFRSIERANVDSQVLEALDVKALLAAVESPGFIHYQPIKGLSYCLWQTHADARVATSAPAHREAARYAQIAYEDFKLLSWNVARTAVPGIVNFEPVDITH